MSNQELAEEIKDLSIEVMEAGNNVKEVGMGAIMMVSSLAMADANDQHEYPVWFSPITDAITTFCTNKLARG